MFQAIALIAESRIQESIDRGDFENLPGKGKPLTVDDDSHVAPELRMAYKILKNSDFLDPKARSVDVVESTELIDPTLNEAETHRKMRKLRAVGFTMEKPLKIDQDGYYEKVVEKVG